MNRVTIARAGRSRRQFLFSSLGAAALCPVARANAPTLISIASSFPAPKFKIGETVLAVWDLDAELKYTRALIIGMAYSPTGHEPGWLYLPRWVDNVECPWSNGKDDGVLWHERYIKALNQ